MIKKILQLLKIRQQEKEYKSDFAARQNTYKQIKEASKYVI